MWYLDLVYKTWHRLYKKVIQHQCTKDGNWCCYRAYWCPLLHTYINHMVWPSSPVFASACLHQRGWYTHPPPKKKKRFCVAFLDTTKSLEIVWPWRAARTVVRARVLQCTQVDWGGTDWCCCYWPSSINAGGVWGACIWSSGLRAASHFKDCSRAFGLGLERVPRAVGHSVRNVGGRRRWWCG